MGLTPSMLFTVGARSCSVVNMWTGPIITPGGDSHHDSLGPSNTFSSVVKAKDTVDISNRVKISSSRKLLPKVIVRVLDKFYKQNIPSAEHIEEQWDRQSPWTVMRT